MAEQISDTRGDAQITAAGRSGPPREHSNGSKGRWSVALNAGTSATAHAGQVLETSVRSHFVVDVLKQLGQHDPRHCHHTCKAPSFAIICR